VACSQEIDLQATTQQSRWRPLEPDIVDAQPQTFAIAELGTGQAQVFGKMSRNAGNSDLSARYLCGCLFDETPSPIHVGDDHDERDSDDRQDDQPTDRTDKNLQRPFH